MATGEWMNKDFPELDIRKGDIMRLDCNDKYHNLRTKKTIEDTCLVNKNSYRVTDFSYDELKRGYRPYKIPAHTEEIRPINKNLIDKDFILR